MSGDRTEVARRLATSHERRLAAIVEASADAIIGLTPDGVVIDWNAAAESIYGYADADIVGRSINELVPGDVTRAPELLEAARRGETLRPHDTVRLTRDGKRIDVSSSIVPIVDDGVVIGIAMIERDVTTRKDTERSLFRATLNLRRKSRALEEFAYTVSHDLKSPIVTLQGFAGVLREELEEGNVDEARGALDRMEGAISRMSSLIERLLTLSRVGRGAVEISDVDARAVLDAVCEEIRPTLEASDVRVEVPGELPKVRAESGLVQQVLTNLLTNACKYGRGPEGVVEVRGETDRDVSRVRVVDRGPGIPEEARERCFAPFQQLDASREGSGVGLAIVRRIMETLEGDVTVEETPGGGATFVLEFPRGGDAERSIVGSHENVEPMP